jgi:predicted transcriptional regulator
MERSIIHEAFVGYLVTGHHYIEALKQRIAAADRGEFASNNEVEAFFAERCGVRSAIAYHKA